MRKSLNKQEAFGKVVSFIEGQGVAIAWIRSKGRGYISGEYDDLSKRVYVETRTLRNGEVKVSWSLIYSLLHEYGHHLDYMTNGFDESWAYVAMDKWEEKGKPISKKAKDTLIECERRAWKFAEQVAEELGINLNMRYQKEKEASLAIYRRIEIKE